LLEMAALPDLSAAIEPLLRVREGMRTERKALDRTLAAGGRRSDVGRRLMTIPGTGPVTTLAHIATVDDPGRFGTSKALGAHLGLMPRVYQSAEIDRSGQISKCGDRNAAAPSLRGRIGVDDRYSQVVPPAGLGCLRRQAPGHEARHRRRGSQACGDHASHLVTGDEFDFGGPAVAAKAA
jgi:Transposase IS116/IS110/IS902 family